MVSCGLDKPDSADGRSVLVLQTVDTSGIYAGEWRGVPGAQVEITGALTAYKNIFTADENGKIVLDGLPTGDYYIQASMRDEEHDVLLTGQTKKMLQSQTEVKDTLFMSFVPLSPIVINELYYCGCNGSSFYFYDQYVELYNSTSDTLYLDGYVVCRSQQSDGIFDIEGADFALGYYVYQFPGMRGVTHQCPIGPHEYLVCATDAINHHNYGALCVNLLGADWEFFNPIQNDYDNLSVPNILPISTMGKDFTLTLTHTGVFLATGEDITFVDYTTSSGVSPFAQVPLGTIVDAVEYGSSPSIRRYMTLRIDAGIGGNGMTSYSGQSIERKVPGFDSNNSSFDFVILGSPTPGYSH